MPLVSKLRKVGLATEPLGAGGETLVYLARSVEAETRRLLRRALAIREVNGGSRKGCEIEITSRCTTPSFGIHFVTSPSHGDPLLVTGPVAHNIEISLSKTYEEAAENLIPAGYDSCN